MAEDFVDRIFAEQPQEVEPVETAPEPVNEAPTPEPAPEVAEPTPEPAPEPEQRGPGYVPIDAMLTERERRQAVERELEQLRRQQVQQPAAPDAFDDPAGFERHVEERIEARVQAQRADMSYQLAVRDHGKDKVEAARAWAIEKAQKEPLFAQQVESAFKSESLPVDWVVQQHKRDSLLTEVGDNVDDWFTREAAKRGYVANSAPPVAAPVVAAQQPAPKPAMPPRSIAADASPAATPPNANPMAAMDAIFTR